MSPNEQDRTTPDTREFLGFLRQIDEATPADVDLHLILDNSSTHKTSEVRAWLEARPRFHVHFTPTNASWLNAVEGWFAQLERCAIYRGTFSRANALRAELKRYIEAHNAYAAKPFRWTQPADAILASVEEAQKALVRP